ncbi:MAG: MupA/Atu3671 family FMN-dependent luciferase-like monooxygenase [Congregibacter sp.]
MSSGKTDSSSLTPLQKAATTIARLKSRVHALEAAAGKSEALQPVAVVGLACRAPGADSAEALWELLSDGRSAMREVPPERWDVNRYFDPRPGVAGKSCTRRGGFIDGVDQFDASFFGISAREAEGMDPQQRILLECAWHSLEDAGIRPSTLKGRKAGVFVGVTATDYGMLQCNPDSQYDVNPYFNTGTPQNVCAGRISYLFGLQGPSMAVDTACSSSLTAIHLACQSLRQGESDVSIAGGVNLTLTPLLYATLSAAGMLAVDGQCKSFDSSANGYARGEGCGLIVLKRLADAQRDGDHIIGLLRGSTLNQDGASSGLTVPNGVAQQKLIRASLESSGITPSDIDYVEAHGTGTPLGDPIEVRALGRVLGQVDGRDEPLRIGSIKSNIGHLESAAGVLSVIKVLLALKHEQLPATRVVDALNPEIDWAALNVMPVLESVPWKAVPERPRRAGVSAFGASGSNAHLVIEEPPAPPALELGEAAAIALLPLSAKGQPSLHALARDYATHIGLARPENLSSIAAGAACLREALELRAAVVAGSPADAQAALHALSSGQPHPMLLGPLESTADERTVFVFSGQGDVSPAMGQCLYEGFPVYRAALQRCAELLGDRVGLGLQQILSADNLLLCERASWAQPALFSLQYALVQLWESLGVRPSAVVGHSLGEFAAAVTAGALSLEDGMTAVIGRARLMESLPEPGAMTAVLSDVETVTDILRSSALESVDVAVINGPGNVVLAGRAQALKQLQAVFTEQNIRAIPLSVTHGFHSRVMDPILEELGEQFARVDASACSVPYFSSLEGRRLSADERVDGDYWRRHSREAVRFSDAILALTGDGYRRFLEIGPAATATALMQQIAPEHIQGRNSTSSLGNPGAEPFHTAVAKLWCDGQSVNWQGIPGYGSAPRVSLPHYPFHRQRYWIRASDSDAHTENKVVTEMNSSQSPKPDHTAILSTLVDIFSELLRLPAGSIDPHAQLIEAGADSLVLVSGVNAIENTFGVKLEIRQLFEEVTTLDAIAGYLAANSAVGQAMPASSSPIGTPTQVSVQQAAAAHPSSATAAINTHSVQFNSGDDLSQLIAAQTQLMARHLDLLQGAGVSDAASSPPQPVAGKAGHAPGAVSRQADAPGSNTVGDRSSPLRALNQPIQPIKSTLSDQQQAHMDALIERYTRKTAESKRLAQANRPVLADSRASVGFRFSTKEILYPITGVESSGSHIRDVDGNDYVDLTMGFGVLLFGSRPEHMQGVLEAELKRGFQLGPRSAHMEEIGQHFSDLTGHDRVAFTNSGTEAVMTALRLARAATGRDKIIIFEGAYNGHSDGTLAKRVVGADGTVHAEPVSPGIPQSVADDCIVVEYGSDDSLAIIRKHAHELGAVLVEPVQSRRLDLQPVDFLKKLRALTTELDVALIFDEMITGFRVHPGGIQGLWGIKADLATYGKILGGGIAIGAVAGAARFMDGIDGGAWQYGDNSYPAARRTYFGGTFCQHPLAMAGCLATLRALKEHGPALQEGLNQRTALFAETLNEFFKAQGLDVQVIHFGSLFTFRFPGNLEIFFYHLLEKGVYIWEWRACFLSLAHTDDDLEHVIRAVKEAVAEMREGGFLPPTRTEARSKLPAAIPAAISEGTSRADQAKNAHAHRESEGSQGSSRNAASKTAFSLYFFGNYDAGYAQGKYDLLVDSCRYADTRGYEAIWLPERHFDKFGGFSPNPSVLAAALARETSHIKIKAGSVVLPLHHPVRVAEEWSLVDNLSDGRVGIAFATGWHPNDFALAPENFEHNRDVTFKNIEVVRKLWEGDSVSFTGGSGEPVDLAIFPRPKQERLPCWLTVVGNPDTYRKAAELGAGILTNLLGQSLEDLEKNLKIYRETWRECGHDPDAMSVAILVHTYLEADAASAIETARQPMSDYLTSSLSLFQKMADTLPAGMRDIKNVSEADKAYVIGKAYERYVAERALIGSPESCQPMLERLLALGVTEIACFLDFGVDGERVMAGLPHLDALRSISYAAHSHAAAAVEPVPTSDAQRQLWLLAQLGESGNVAYNDPALVEWRGALDEQVLAGVLDEISRRHESLRSTLSDDGRQLQIHVEPLSMLECIDCSGAEQPDEAATARIQEIVAAPLSLSAGPLFKPFLLRLTDERHRMLLLAHHIVSDGPSMGILIREIAALYTARVDGAPGPVLETPYQYREFVAWQSDARNGEAMSEHRKYWQESLTALPGSSLELPWDKPRPALRTWAGRRLCREIDAPFTRDIERAARAAGVTVYMFLHAAFTALLHRWSGTSDIVMGAASSGRAIPGSENMVGYAVHLMALRTQVTPATRVRDHLTAVRAMLLNAYDHQLYPFAWLLDDLDLPHDPGRPSLVNVIFNYERLPVLQPVGDLEMRPALPPVSQVRVDLTLTVNHIGDHMEWVADFNTDLFDAATIERLLTALRLHIVGFQETPDCRLAELPLMEEGGAGDGECLAAIHRFNESGEAPAFIPIHRLIEAQAEATPAAPAVRVLNSPDSTMDFATLNRRANALAAHLAMLEGGVPERTAICLDQSPNLMVALLACLKAGTAYVPLDPAYPEQRLAFLCKDADVGMLITDSARIHTLADAGCPRCLIDELSSMGDGAVNLDINPLPAQCAYVIYTSGSTGLPKGVAVSHQGLSNYVTWAADAYAAGTGAGAPLLCSVGFDAAVTSLFAPLVSGKPTVLLQGENELDALRQLAETDEKYSFLKLTPAHLEVLNRYRELQDSPNHELASFLVLGGEALPAAFLAPWFANTDAVAVNEYGPTEAVVGCCVYRASGAGHGSVPIGKPIRGTRLYILDEEMNPVLPGMRGELFIGGVGVAQGYVNRPQQTAQAFIPDPFAIETHDAGSRLYRTGDVVRLGRDGNLEFLGRADAQIKLHGFRIEPGEIEAAALEHPAVSQVAVLVHSDASAGRSLIAFVSCNSELPVDEMSIKSWLRRYLPAHMVPSRVIQLEEMPLSSHGKIDHAALCELELTRASGSGDRNQQHAPKSGIEQRIAEVWCALLSRDDVGSRDNFFDLGGSSLTLLEAHRQLSDILPPGCEVIELFRHPTIAGLARYAAGGPQNNIKAKRTGAQARAERQLNARQRRKR